VLLLDALQDTSRPAPVIAVASSGTPAAEALATVMGRQLALAAHAINLSRIVAAHSQPAQIDVTLQLQPNCSRGITCRSIPRSLTPHDRAELCGGDQVSMELSNPRFEPVDVTVLYIDAAYGVEVLYPNKVGETSRLEPKGRQRFHIDILGEPSGVERLLVLTAQAMPQSPIVSFASLAQAGLPTAERGSSPSQFDLWRQAAFASNPLTSSRGTNATMADSIGATTYAWTVMAHESANAGCKSSQRQP
jgi:hypothetical protein